ncbi:MAG TPA: hypothetical protein VFQ16_01330 [Burkholderiaceae bacterium]|nr:hypothetical protein [Burkholderiaceae bacterium]
MSTRIAQGFALSAALSAALLGGCAAITVAQMELPAALSGAVPQVFQGLRYGRQGRFDLDGATVRFERSADRLQLFDALSQDKAAVSYTLERAGQLAVRAQCRARRTEVSLGVLVGAARPLHVQCEWSGGATARLDIAERSAAAGTRQEREGRYTEGDTVFEIRSVHRLQGSPLPLAQPAGYVVLRGGQAVGALELTDSVPRLWAIGPPAQQQSVVHAAVALGLLWDPGAMAP